MEGRGVVHAGLVMKCLNDFDNKYRFHQPDRAIYMLIISPSNGVNMGIARLQFGGRNESG